MYKAWKLGNVTLGVASSKQIAFSGGIDRYSYGNASLYVWLDVGPFHIWLGGLGYKRKV